MAGLSHQESRRRYSWWWDSHISPKNSRWLQENLTGMDSKVKQMIKLIEEDADSFARRAEMYYKRRPELMRLVEEFYRAYRALAERYDHATGVIRHAHKTMVEAFPDQVPSLMNEEVDANSPFMPPSVREFFDPDEMHKDALGLSSPDLPVKKNGDMTEEPEFVRSRRGLKQLDFFEKGRTRKGLNFNNGEEKERNVYNGSKNNANAGDLIDSKRLMNKHDADILVLKEALAKLEAEKEAGLLQYQKSLERLSNMEKEIMLAQEDSKKLTERASQAEAEVELLKGALIELKAEKELVLLQYQQCLDKISSLEEQIVHSEQDAKESSDRAESAENEVQLLKQELAGLQAEKEAIAAQHKQCTETISVIETKLQQAEETSRRAIERAEMAESKVDNLNLAIIQLAEEKEACSVQCQQYLERISTLEFQILFSQEENQRLNEEIDNGKAKLQSAEEHCRSVEYSHLSLQSELESLIRNMESKNKELTEKQIELGTLWNCVQEERLRFVEAETAFQTLQHLHNESQEELTALESELQNRVQMVQDLEIQNQCLQEELFKIQEQNRTLNAISMSSEVSMRNMQDELSTTRATIVQLQEEIERRANERKDLLQEINSVKEELHELNQNHEAVLEQMEALELGPQSFVCYVKELRENSSKLNDAYQIEKSEKEALLEKLNIMAELLEKNALLEKSITDLNGELQQAKEKVKMLEETCRILAEEKSTAVAEKNVLHSQLQNMTEDLGALTKKRVSLENSLADVEAELELVKEKSRMLEESLLLAGNEKARLLNETESLSLQLKSTKRRLEEMEMRNEELEVSHFNLETQKKLLVCSIGELLDLLESAKQENFNSAKFYQTRLASLECQLSSLQEKAQLTQSLYNEEVDKSISAEIGISLLRDCLQELHVNNSSLKLQCLKFSEASRTSQNLVTLMEQKNADQQAHLEALTDALELVNMGFLQMAKTLDIDIGIMPVCKYENKIVSHPQPQLNQVLGTLEEIRKALAITLDENQQLVIEKSILFTLLGQLRLDAADIDSEKCILSQNLKSSAQRLLKLFGEAHILLETNEGLKSSLKEGEYRENTLRNGIEELRLNLLDVKGSYQTLKRDNNMVLEEKNSLMIEVRDLKDAKFALEDEINDILGDAVSLDNIFLVFKHFFPEKSIEVKELDESMHHLHCTKNILEELIRKLEEKLEALLTDKSRLMKSMEESEKELTLVRSVSEKMNEDIANEKELVYQKEMELSKVKCEFEALQNEQTKLQRTIEDLKKEYDNLKATNEKQAEHILKLSEDNGLKSEENEDLWGSKQSLEIALKELRKKHQNAKMRELILKSELQRWRNKEKLWEKEFLDVFSSLQMSAIHETCYLEKFHELRKKFESVTSISGSADAEAQRLKERIMALEAENAGLKAHFSDYESAVNSLSGSVASLERQTIFHEKSSKMDGAKDAGSASHLQSQVNVQADSSNVKVGTGFSELKNFQSRIEAVELAVDDIRRLASERSLGSSVRAEASSIQTDELASGRSLRLERAVARRERTHNSSVSSEITELPKDIMLDQISACSSYGLSKREITPADDHMLELWATSKESSMNCSDVRIQRLASHRKEISLSGKVSAKEMAIVDKLEISQSPKQQKKKNGKILERLHFDAQKLETLQNTVQELKTKVETAEKMKKTTGVLEYDTVKEQLEEAEEAIEKLLAVNEKLTRSVEDDSSSPKSTSENGSSDESVIVRRRRVLEQIRRASEKISRLNFEVQKLQFLLINLESEKQKEAVKTKVIPRSPRVRLRDYLNGGSRPVFAHKQKRRQFCGCIRPPTKGD